MPGAAGSVTGSISLFEMIEDLTDALRPSDYIPPEIESPAHGSAILGEASDMVKRLHTVLAKLETWHFAERELLTRGTQAALSFEVMRHFGLFGKYFGITRDWIVYAKD